MSEDAGGVEDCAVIDFWLVGCVAQIEVSSNAAARIAGVQVAGVAVYLQNHVAGVESDHRIGVCGAIIEEAEDVFFG